ncbi:MAG: NDP-sugar synthase [Candidatus Eremiobacteraeota bacterium]|nr:NDP-sugar synthase [Candidatus Eremiobacteraeota bacterium]
MNQANEKAMQAVILVGGEGTRLRPLTYGTPKPMVPIMNVPFLARTMERLYEAGIREAILAAGYMPKAIVEYFGDGERIGIKVTYAIEETPLGTAGALKNVEQHITGPFFVLNGDIFTSLDLTAMLRYHEAKGGAGVLHLIRVDDPSAFGCVVHDESGRISAFVEKPPKDQAPTDEINAGTYLLERGVLDFIPAGRPVSIERETFPEIIAKGKELYAYTTSDYWIDLGRPEQYLAAHRDVLRGTMPLAVEPGLSGEGADALRGHPGVVPPVHAGGDVVVDASARIGPNVVLGRGCSIGADATVKESVLWERVSVGAGAMIEEAIVASGATIGARARVPRGSVIGHDVEIDPDAVLEPGARVGSPQRTPG